MRFPSMSINIPLELKKRKKYIYTRMHKVISTKIHEIIIINNYSNDSEAILIFHVSQQ